jgi:hypothetical protein
MPGKPLRLRIIGTHPPGTVCGVYTGVRVGIQIRQDTVDAVPADQAPTFIATVQVDDDGDVRGPAIHGRRGERFVYLVWLGRENGAPEAMFRRAKLQLDGVPPEVLAAAAARGTLTATVPLTDAQGMPACASIRPPDIRWEAS